MLTLSKESCFSNFYIKNNVQIQEPEAAVERALDQPLDEVVAAHLRSCWAWANSGLKIVQLKTQKSYDINKSGSG